MRKLFYTISFCISLILPATAVQAQVVIRGTVYDSLARYPVSAVSVLSSSGKGTTTDSNGHYTITVNETDSVWFSYLSKPTRRFPVRQIKNPFAFDISLMISIPTLPTIHTRPRDYRYDSIQNRLDYAKIFDYQKPGLYTSSGDGTAGFDLDQIINAFRFKRNQRMQAFQTRLVNEERDNFIKHRFNKGLIRRLTPLQEDSTLNIFIEMYKPSYLFTARASDYMFQKYIKDSYARFEKGILPDMFWLEGYTDEKNAMN